MQKIFNLKSWLTLGEAAEHLSRTLSESVTVPDVLRLALDGHLVLSVNFVNHATANLGKKVSFDDARLVLFPDLSKPDGFALSPEVAELVKQFPRDSTRELQHEWLLANRAVSDSPNIVISISGDRVADGVLEWDQRISSIDGIWDLPLSGGAMLDVEHLLQSMTGGPAVTLTCLDGTYVVGHDGQTHARVLEKFEEPTTRSKSESVEGLISRVRKFPGDQHSYFPSDGLPDDAPIVVRPASLRVFLASLESGAAAKEGDSEKSLQPRERNNLLRIIRAVDAMNSRPLPARGYAESIRAKLAELGLSDISDDTIRKAIEGARGLDS